MKTIFDCETEIVHKESSPWEHRLEPLTYEECSLFAHTRAYLNNSHTLLKIEQRCYFRSGQEMPDQPWSRPEVILEPGLPSEEAMLAMAQSYHEQYIQKLQASALKKV